MTGTLVTTGVGTCVGLIVTVAIGSSVGSMLGVSVTGAGYPGSQGGGYPPATQAPPSSILIALTSDDTQQLNPIARNRTRINIQTLSFVFVFIPYLP
jgi:hypothetical protein